MGSAESSEGRRVSFGMDEEERVRVLQGIRLSENVVNRMKDSSQPSKVGQPTPPSTFGTSKGPEKESKLPRSEYSGGRLPSGVEEDLLKRYKQEQATVQDELFQVATREREAATQHQRASLQGAEGSIDQEKWESAQLGKKLRGFSCELTRSRCGVFPETTFASTCQILVPILLSGLGVVTAGLVMNTVRHWPVFVEVKDLLTLVPPLVGLKGNLEMTLASRLSTAANTGQIDDPQEQHRVISSNLALVQVQATVVGLLAAVAALLLGAVSREELDLVKVELLCASSVVTAFLAAFVLGMLMVCIVVGARKLGINPDNIATPLAASLGDLLTLSLLAFVSSFFYTHKDSQYLMPLICIGFTALTPVWVLVAKRNPPILKILKFGWFPIILAMVISSFGGLILNKTISKPQYAGMAVFAPIICGVGGNLVAVQTSRISTYLHMWSTPGVPPVWMKNFWPNPCSTFCTSEINSMSARVLLFLVVPGHLIFFCVIYLVEGHSVPNSKTFVVYYLLAGLIQVTVLLYLAEVMVRLTWHHALDPDNHCILYLTGLGDLLGTGLLALCFFVTWLPRSEVGPAGVSGPGSGPPQLAQAAPVQ